MQCGVSRDAVVEDCDGIWRVNVLLGGIYIQDGRRGLK